jgi:hypothetical protein
MSDPVKLTVDAALEVDGREDTTQLRVQGHSTQSEPLQTWEDSSGEVQTEVTGEGRLRANEVELNVQASTPADDPPAGVIKLYAKIIGDNPQLYAKYVSEEVDLAGSSGGSAGSSLKLVALGW